MALEKMIIRSASFFCSSSGIHNCPKTDLPEFAFIGRSNVGKSSLINMLTGRKNLAKVSQTPGKTRLINHFLINDEWFLVDLPGYGFSRISRTEKTKIENMVVGYMTRRSNLKLTFLLIDSRHPLQKSDLIFLDWLFIKQVPFIIILTKTDKLSSIRLNNNLRQLRHSIPLISPDTGLILSSAIQKTGGPEILNIIAGLL